MRAIGAPSITWTHCSLDPEVIVFEDRRDTMDQRPKDSAADTAEVFSEAEYSADAGKIIAHAAATGRAVVASADGRQRVVISIPTVDLPVLGD